MSKIAVIGTGYVGLVTGTCFADLGNHVTCVDLDEQKIERLKEGHSPIFEPELEEKIQRNGKAGRLEFTTRYEDALQDTEIVFIAVGTPAGQEGSADMKYVEAAAQSIAKAAPGRAHQPLVIVNKSTVPIGSGEKVAGWVSANAPEGFQFSVVSNPEFLREGQAVRDFLNPDRIILGSDDPQAMERMKELYKSLGCPILTTKIRTAEMIKYASNAILATYISFINEIAQICEKQGADVKEVVEGMGYDKRINSQFLNPGVGFGGSCFPKDVAALAHMAENGGSFHPQLLRAVLDINRDARTLFTKKIITMLDGDVEGKRIAVLGLSFKPDTDDTRESPAIDIIKQLIQAGAYVQVFDPAVKQDAWEAAIKITCPEISNKVHFCTDAYKTAKDADALALITAWNEFKQLDMETIRHTMRRPVLVDGRNIYDPEEMRDLGFTYAGVGRK